MAAHPTTEAVEAIIGPHLTRDCAKELAASIVENLLASGWLQPGDLTMPAISAERRNEAIKEVVDTELRVLSLMGGMHA
jgi:hypothetical protein